MGGSNICTGGTPLSGSHFGSDVAANAFDGNINTFWGSTAYPDWLGYDFGLGNAVTVVEIKWTTRNDSQYTHPS